jgi:hypothetical protein
MNTLLATLSPFLLLIAAPPTLDEAPTPDTGSVEVAREDEEKQARDVSQFNLGKHNLALEGYDPVAYFKEGGGKPRKGSKSIELVHRGVRYRFATEKNRDLFKKSPAAFEPLYGGWCAYAMARGEQVEVDPKSFLVTDGQLKVFYKSFFNDTRKKWNKEPQVLKPKSDAAWKKLTEQK